MLFDDRPRLLPTAVMGRTLTCTRCGKPIDLVEIPGPDVDPDTYVCLDHFQPVANPAYKRSAIRPTGEPPAPPRDLRQQIRDYHANTFGNAA